VANNVVYQGWENLWGIEVPNLARTPLTPAHSHFDRKIRIAETCTAPYDSKHVPTQAAPILNPLAS